MQAYQTNICSDGPLAAYRLLEEQGSLKPDPEQEAAARRLQDLHDDLQAVGIKPAGKAGAGGRLRRFLGMSTPVVGPRGIYIHGGVGRGKSMLMDIFFAAAPVAAKRRVHFHAFMLEVHEQIHRWRQMSEAARRRQAGTTGDDPIPPLAANIAQKARLLCFDEFQVTDVADAMILARLFTELLDRGVVVVSTSNRAPEALYEGGLNRQLFLPFIDLLRQKLDVLELDGPIDYRLHRLGGAPVYYWPADDKATKALSETFYRLTDHEVGDRAAVGPDEIEVQGRKLFVPIASRGVAVFSFKRLCEGALGAADYLAVAWRYHTVILVGIPKLGPEKRNEAKRFVTLIDALYENNVKLLCSAAAAPEELYVEGHGQFEFQRTVSRLQEMQSQDYLSRGHAV